MLAARLHGPGDLRLEDLPCPEPGPGEVVLRVERALTCTTDLKIFRQGSHPALGPLPSPFGHEVAGVVAAVGEGVKSVAVGQRVTLGNSAPCGRCDYCRQARFSLCTDMVFFFGAFAQYARVPARVVELNLYPIPAGLPAAHAALVEPLACALRAVDLAGVGAGTGVLVLGGGALGLMLARVARLRGARVGVVDWHPERLAVARRLGTDFTLSSADLGWQAFGEGPDVVFEAVGRPEAWEEAVQLVRPGGLVVFFGGCPPGTRACFDTGRVHYKELALRGAFHHHPTHVRQALGLIASGAIPPEIFISGEVPLRRLTEALELMAARRGLKYAVNPWAE
jgi:L-iditol 2-dehydrogenase